MDSLRRSAPSSLGVRPERRASCLSFSASCGSRRRLTTVVEAMGVIRFQSCIQCILLNPLEEVLNALRYAFPMRTVAHVTASGAHLVLDLGTGIRRRDEPLGDRRA